jgi:oxygen-independent coproporphyrinogen-3 oxidase
MKMSWLTSVRERLVRDLHRDPGILILAYPYARTWLPTSEDTVVTAWRKVQPGSSAAIYIHIPFCRQKCSFCDFLAYYGRPDSEVHDYVALILKEAALAAERLPALRVDAVHFGGGTPSLLSGSELGQILDRLAALFVIDAKAEVTLEVFPDPSVDRARLAGWRDAGIRRVSFGIQFFNENLARRLNRAREVDTKERLVEEAQRVGFEDINLDLMCGLPELTAESWQTTVEKGLSLAPSHVCIFPVSVRHPGIALHHCQDRLPPPDETRKMYDVAAEKLLANGYVRTTRHNFVRPPFAYRYERMIADLQPLVALGANSIGYAEDFIYRNHSDLRKYRDAILAGSLPVSAGYCFPRKEMPHNFAVRGIEYLRLDGEKFLRQFGVTVSETFADVLELLMEYGLVISEGPDLILTDEGVYYTSAVKRALFHPSRITLFPQPSGKQEALLQIERGGL